MYKPKTMNTENSQHSKIIKQLEDDRVRIVKRKLLPMWFHPALALVAAAYTLTLAQPEGAGRNSGYFLALISTIVLIYVAQRTTGVKLNHAGFAGFLVLAFMFIAVIMGLIVMLALLSFGHDWWIIVPALAVFGAVSLLSRLFEKLASDRIVNGR